MKELIDIFKQLMNKELNKLQTININMESLDKQKGKVLEEIF